MIFTVKVLVTGGRNFADRDFLFRYLSAFHVAHPIETLIHGGAPGTDHLADKWAEENEVNSFRYAAKWKTLAKRAGPERNYRMLKESEPDWILAFPGGAGTESMVRYAIDEGYEYGKFLLRILPLAPIEEQIP